MADPQAPEALTQEQIEELLSNARVALHRFVRSILGADDAAHDAVQETFVDAWQAARSLRAPFVRDADPAAVRRWLFHTAYCNAISLRRRDQAGVRRLITRAPDARLEGAPHAHPGAVFEDRVAEKLALQSALDALRPEDASAILLAVVHGFSASEIAARLAISPDAFRQRLSRAMRRLRAAYLVQDPPPPATATGAATTPPTFSATTATTTVTAATGKEQAPS